MILERIQNASDKKLEKARILAEVKKPSTYNYRGIDISIQDHKVLEDGRLRVIANATKNGQHIPIENPMYFINPPCCVPDGTTRIEVIDDEEVELSNYEYNPQAALKEIVGQTISTVLKSKYKINH